MLERTMLITVVISIIVLSVWGLGSLVHWYVFSNPDFITNPAHKSQHHYSITVDGVVHTFDLVDPQMAPPHIQDKVLFAYLLFNNPKEYAPEYAGDNISCNNCHFCGGNSLGGKNAGISLVGVTNFYPAYSKRDHKNITLADRVNNCFKRSLNGKPIPEDSQLMEALLLYLGWISSEVSGIKDLPWRGLPDIESKHVPDPKKGKILYKKYCNACHQADGTGTEGVPPLWGPTSFNDGAGMGQITMMAPFVMLNMPFQQAFLTEEQALDVSSYVIQQPRPHFVNKSGK